MSFSTSIRIAVVVSLVFACIAPAEPSLTIYNRDFAVVCQPLSLDLSAGINEVRVTDITAQMEPDPFTRTDGQTVEFRIQVPAGQEKTVTYKAHYTW